MRRNDGAGREALYWSMEQHVPRWMERKDKAPPARPSQGEREVCLRLRCGQG
jgi:hypothetical protein